MQLEHTEHDVAERGALRSFVRRARSEILAEWQRVARQLPESTGLPSIELVDHIPELLDQLAEVADTGDLDDSTDRAVETARRHAIDRLGAGFDLASVVRELSLLRSCILRVWAREYRAHEGHELAALMIAVDRAITESVLRFVEARDRTLAAIDRISTASLESSTLDDLLQRLLIVFMRTTASVDTAAILLVEGDELRMRASVGFDERVRSGFRQRIGEGFAGHVAAERTPIELRSAFMHPLVTSRALRERGVRALYGVPLLQDTRVIGVAYMGSTVAHEFSHEDRHLFGSMAARATAGIYHHVLREQLAASETRFKQIAAERERHLAKLEALLAAAPVAIGFIDRDCRFIRLNDAFAAMNGRSAAEHVGRTVREVVPAIADRLETIVRHVVATGEPVLNEEITRPAITPDGPPRSFLATYFPVRSPRGEITGVGGIATEVTDIKRMQDALARSEARLQAIVEHAPVAIFVKDEQGRLVMSNARTAEVVGHPGENVLGLRSDELLPADVAAPHMDHDWRVLREQRVIEAEEVVPSSNGPRTFLSVKFLVPGEDGRLLICGIATEITERKQMEERLRDAIRARDEVLAIVSHDLRNPLHAVQLSATMLRSAPTDEPRTRKHLDLIRRACDGMEHLISDLLDAASIRGGSLTVTTKREPAEAVIREAIDLQSTLAHEKHIRLERGGEPLDIDVCCDRDRVLQIFANLIGNAIKFCRPSDSVTVGAVREGDFVRFFVADTGPGISDEAAAHIFEAYRTTPEKAGAGLGLYIARGLVERHGGRIWLERSSAPGATFAFTIPIAR